MTKAFIALVFLSCLASSVSADCKGDLAKLLPLAIQLFADASSGNTSQFEIDLLRDVPALEAAGVSCNGITPTSKCNNDIKGLGDYTRKIIDDIANENAAQLKADCAKAAPYFNTAILDCTGFQVSSQCSEDLLLMIQPGSAFIDDIRNDQTSNLQEDLKDFLPFARSSIQDCSGNQISDTCQNQINVLVPFTADIIADLLDGNTSALIAQLQAAITALNLVVQGCLGHGVSATCQSDLIGLVPAGLAVFSDIKSKNWSQLQADLQAAEPQIDAAWQACIGGTSA